MIDRNSASNTCSFSFHSGIKYGHAVYKLNELIEVFRLMSNDTVALEYTWANSSRFLDSSVVISNDLPLQ